MTSLLVGDVGGTHARFAIAHAAKDQPIRLESIERLAVAHHGSLEDALSAYLAGIGRVGPMPAAIAVAGDVTPGIFTLTNSGWLIDRDRLLQEVGLLDILVLNDFEVIAYTLSDCMEAMLTPLAGPPGRLPDAPVTVLGPGTGLGVALALSSGRVIPTEGGHVGFAPADDEDLALLAALRARFGRVSAERLASGPGLAAIVEARRHPHPGTDADLWAAALAGVAPFGSALDRWLSILGSVAGDLVLAQGAGALVVAGSLAGRLGDRLGREPFLASFRNKGRFAGRMAGLPIRRLDHPEPGLAGAACAWLARSAKG